MKNKAKKLEKISRTIGILFVLFLFSILIAEYYGPGIINLIKGDPRFVKVNYKLLEQEANLANSNFMKNRANTPAKNVFVLTYHRVTNGPPEDDYDISYEQFKEDMMALKNAGYQTITLDELYSFMRGEKQIPDKSFVLTFDDGIRQTYYNTDPILEVLNYTAVMFVITGHSIDGSYSPYYLNKEELKKLLETGRWEFGAHTDNLHFRLPINSEGEVAPALTNKLWFENESRIETNQEFYNRINNDLKISKSKIEKTFLVKTDSFALPYGDFGERGSNYPQANSILIDLTLFYYDMIFYEFPLKNKAFRSNYNTNPSQKNYRISRILADGLRTPEELLQIINASRTIEIPYQEDYSNPDKWVRNSGVASFYNDSIELYNTNILSGNTSVVMAYLDGSYLIEDYTYSIQLKNSKALQIDLISRYQDPQNFVQCTYSTNEVLMIKKIDSSQEIVNRQKIPDNYSITENSKLSISVFADHVSCSLNENNIIIEKIPDIPKYGGVGIGAREPSNTTFIFGNISITPAQTKNFIQNTNLNFSNKTL